MSGIQIDRLCQDWLQENYSQEITSEYMRYSLVVPTWNSVELNGALQDLKLMLCLAFGPEQSFGSTDYYEAREKLGLPDDRTPIPDVFIRTFAST